MAMLGGECSACCGGWYCYGCVPGFNADCTQFGSVSADGSPATYKTSYLGEGCWYESSPTTEPADGFVWAHKTNGTQISTSSFAGFISNASNATYFTETTVAVSLSPQGAFCSGPPNEVTMLQPMASSEYRVRIHVFVVAKNSGIDTTYFYNHEISREEFVWQRAIAVSGWTAGTSITFSTSQMGASDEHTVLSNSLPYGELTSYQSSLNFYLTQPTPIPRPVTVVIAPSLFDPRCG